MLRYLCYHQMISGRGRLAAGAAGHLRRRVKRAAKAVSPKVGIRHRWYDIHAAM